ncbi:pilus assembly FimT family protein [Sporosarcina obsidiansis]|uniref:pilus assembly FimT family protein n=1 Tax=Sporosarcina obsidiansis TaxID=2660748 RepID=UPI00129BE29C|nr:prepilin-type N-terminal cleavage/methylation domain-containing protein [Sporosarcina obsidiansis]
MRELFFDKRGLTLIELLAVIVILGIIAAIAVPSISNLVDNSRIKATKDAAILGIRSADLYFVDNPHPLGHVNSVNLTALVDLGYLEGGMGLLDNSVYFADEQPTRICGALYIKNKPLTNENIIKFYKATTEEILDSGNSLHVGNTTCGDNEVPPAKS